MPLMFTLANRPIWRNIAVAVVTWPSSYDRYHRRSSFLHEIDIDMLSLANCVSTRRMNEIGKAVGVSMTRRRYFIIQFNHRCDFCIWKSHRSGFDLEVDANAAA